MRCGASWETLTNTSVVSSDGVWTGDVLSTVRMKNLGPVHQFCVSFSDIPAVISHPAVVFWTASAQSVVRGGGPRSLVVLCWVPGLLQPSLESTCLYLFHVLRYHQWLPARSTTWATLVFLTAPWWFHPDSFLPKSFTLSGFWTWAETLPVLWGALLSSCKFILTPADDSHTRYCWLLIFFTYLPEGSRKQPGNLLSCP